MTDSIRSITLQSFPYLSVSVQIKILQQIFTQAALLPGYGEKEDQTLQSWLKAAAQSAQNLRESGKTASSKLYASYAVWIDFLLDQQTYLLHALILQKLYNSLNSHNPGIHMSVELYPYSSSLFQIEMKHNAFVIKLHECFITMTDEDVEAFGGHFGKRNWKTAGEVLKPITSRSNTQLFLKYFGQNSPAQVIRCEPHGKNFDLAQIFDQVNQRCFSGKISSPQLRWSSRPNRNRMGSYDHRNDILMVNCALDRPDTPAYVIDFIIYHELLHKVLGVKVQNGRHAAHTSDFHYMEKKHPHYEEAQAWLKKLASGKL